MVEANLGGRPRPVSQQAYLAICQIPEAEMKLIFLRLGGYSLRVCRAHRWRTKNAQNLPDGETPASLVTKAFELVLSGKRDWDPVTGPPLEKYLMDVIDSLISNLSTSCDNRILVSVPQAREGLEPAEMESRTPPPSAEWLASSGRSPEDILLAREQAAMEEQALDMLIDECEDHTEARVVLQETFDGCEKSSQIAAKTGLSITQVYNASKRISERIGAVRRRLGLTPTRPAARGGSDD
jgi:hypothetical protein